MLFIIAGVIIGTVYQEEVKRAVMKEISKNLSRPIDVDPSNIHFSLFSKFPKASLEINNISIPGIDKEAPKLLKAKKLFLMFDMLSVFTKNFEIDAVDVQEGDLNIGYEEGARANFYIWKENKEEEGNEDDGVEVNLTMINLDDMKFSYFDEDEESKYAFHLDKIDLYPIFNETNVAFASEGNLSIIKLQNPDFTFEKAVSISHQLRGGNYYFNTDEFKMRELELELDDKVVVNANGSIIDKKDGVHFNLKANTEKTDISDLLALLPADYVEDITPLQLEGESALNITINNTLTNLRAPDIKIDFDAQDMKFILKEENISFDNISAKGFYFYDGESIMNAHKINVSNFSMQMDESKIQGEIAISEMKNPFIKIKGVADVRLEDLQKKIQLKNVETMTGSTHTIFDFQGKLSDIFIDKNTQYLQQLKSDGEMTFNNVNIKLVDDPNQYKDIHGKISFNNRDFAIDSLMGYANTSDFNIQGKVPDIYLYLLGQADFKMSASIQSNKFSMDEFLSESESSDDDDYKINLPEKTTLQLKFDIGKFIFRKFEADNMKGSGALEDQMLKLNDFVCSTSNGKAKINGFVDASKKDKIVFECSSQLEKINVKKLFSSFENFGQDFIMDKHIDGVLTSTIYFKAEADTNLNIDLKKMYTRAHIKIENGKLTEFPSLMELDEFLTKEYKMKNLDLAHLTFATMENDIEIADQNIIIPDMEIKSSALSINVAGEHGFDEKINYRFKIKSSELIKAYRKKKNDNNEFIEQEEEQSGIIPFYMKGTVDNPEFGYDKETRKEIVKTKIDAKKDELRDAFKKEFSSDKKSEEKKDSKVDDKQQEGTKPRLDLEWDGK